MGQHHYEILLIHSHLRAGSPIGRAPVSVVRWVLFFLQNWRSGYFNNTDEKMSTFTRTLQTIDITDKTKDNVAKRIPGTLFLRNLIGMRSLLFRLVRRDFEQRFVGSAMGWIWGVIHPLVLLASWWFVFSVCMRQTLPPGEVTQNYALFLFAGMLPWLLFSDTVQRSAASVLDQANLITKTVFPAEIVPVSVFLSSLMSHLLALAMMMAAAAVFLNQISFFLILLPFYMFAIGLFAVGVGWI